MYLKYITNTYLSLYLYIKYLKILNMLYIFFIIIFRDKNENIMQAKNWFY